MCVSIEFPFEYPSDPSSTNSDEGIYKSSKHDPDKMAILASQRALKQMKKSDKTESEEECQSKPPPLEVEAATLPKLPPIMMKSKRKTPSPKKPTVPSAPKKPKRRRFKPRL